MIAIQKRIPLEWELPTKLLKFFGGQVWLVFGTIAVLVWYIYIYIERGRLYNVLPMDLSTEFIRYSISLSPKTQCEKVLFTVALSYGKIPGSHWNNCSFAFTDIVEKGTSQDWKIVEVNWVGRINGTAKAAHILKALGPQLFPRASYILYQDIKLVLIWAILSPPNEALPAAAGSTNIVDMYYTEASAMILSSAEKSNSLSNLPEALNSAKRSSISPKNVCSGFQPSTFLALSVLAKKWTALNGNPSPLASLMREGS